MAEQVKLCPCGSGRQQKYCCGEKATGWRRVMNLALPWALVVLMAGAATAMVLMRPTTMETPTNTSQAEAGTPEPWEYDRLNNRHWDPNHGHWHPGPPPGEEIDPMPGQTADATMPDGSLPEPWEYDAENDRHWHPDHGHWHPGPPPENPGSSTTGNSSGQGTPTPPTAPNSSGSTADGSTPEPWEYDEENDQHWNPDHGHWHPGPPPPPENR